MKKLLSLVLCIVLMCFTFVGCKKEEIGDYLSNYETDALTDDQIVTLNFYIITGDETNMDFADKTVRSSINTYLKEKYHIELNISYFTEAEYTKNVLLTAMGKDKEADRPDVILINSAQLFKDIDGTNSLLALNKGEFNFFGTDFKSLNTIVESSLLAASEIDGTYYAVPNNHLVGKYEYIVINKEMARDTLHFPEDEIASMTTIDSLEVLKARIADLGLDENDYIRVVEGDYTGLQNLKKYDLKTNTMPTETKENPAPEVNFVNVKAYPNATAEEAFLSAFAIVKQLDDNGDPVTYSEEKKALLKSHYTKCMQIIYALNTDAEFKNMLQYGYIGTNYTLNKDIANTINLIRNDEVRYDMNNIHTGNPYISYYCDEISWDASTQDVWKRQNAYACTPEQKMLTEASNIEFTVTQAKAGDVIDTKLLPSIGTNYTDVTITWTVDDKNVVFNNGVITFKQPEKDTDVVITAVFTCCGDTYKHTFTVKLKTK